MSAEKISKKIANERKNAAEILERYFETNNMIFYKRETESLIIFLLPYYIEKQDIRFDIKVSTFCEEDTCRMSFSCELNTDRDFSKELLNMNSDLINGNLSVEKDSNQVTYSIIFDLENEMDVEKLYNKNLELCLSVLASLYKNKIVKFQKKENNENK